MGNPQQYYPLPEEYLWVGLIGIFLYLGILYFSIASMVLGFRSKSTKRFFVSVMIMAVLELPRFFSLSIDKSYTSKSTYCAHIIAGIFFFLAFSIVCRQWSGLLQLGSYFRVVYGYHSLAISNVLFALIDIISVGLCASSDSLEDYFESDSFEVITMIEGFRNCIYSVFLSYYGLKLVKRFWHFSKLEKQTSRRQLQKFYYSNNSRFNEGTIWDRIKGFFTGGIQYRSKSGSIASSFDGGNAGNKSVGISSSGTQKPQLPLYDQVFTKVVTRLTLVLTITTICFLFRLTMLAMKLIALHSNTTYTTPQFSLFGLLWFTCSDFIPRTLPSFAFIFLMRTKRPGNGPSGGSHQEGLNSRRSSEEGKSTFQFVVFSHDDEEDEEEYHYDPHDLISNPLSDPSGNEDTKTISFLRSDQFFSDQSNHSEKFKSFVIEDDNDIDNPDMLTDPHAPKDFRDSISEYGENEDEEDDREKEFGTDAGEVAIDAIINMLSPIASMSNLNSGNSRSSSQPNSPQRTSMAENLNV